METRERPRWHLIAYLIVLIALLAIGSVTYTTYAFSKYRGEILPGVSIDTVYVGEMTPGQAFRTLLTALQPAYAHPIRLRYNNGRETFTWSPSPTSIGYQIYPLKTVNQAEKIGRTETFPEQLIDRLPVHPTHTVALAFTLNERVLHRYIMLNVNNPKLFRQVSDARLQLSGTKFVVIPGKPGERLDAKATTASVRDALGTLSAPVRSIAVQYLHPNIGNAVAQSYAARVNNFLAHPPVYLVGKNPSPMTAADLAPMISFSTVDTPKQRAIVMRVDPVRVQDYISGIAARYDRNPVEPRFTFDGKSVHVEQEGRKGRQLNQQDAYSKLLAAITGLKTRARLRFKVTRVSPAIDQQNPGTLGITTFLGSGETSFAGAGDQRVQDITSIVNRTLDNTLIQPNEDISFNQLVGFNWPGRVYDDHEIRRAGQFVPADSGAMQQVATTFMRALFIAGLQVLERHSHVYDLPWYDNALGLDAVVSQDGNQDLRFHNTTGKYLFIKTRVEPIRQELFIYVYGPKLGWQIKDTVNVIARQPHPPRKVIQDASLAPGEVRHLAYAHDGLRVAFERTIVYPDGRVRTVVVRTSYRPWQAVVAVGPGPSPTATPKPSSRRTAVAGTATPTSSASPTPTAASPTPNPTPTFNH